MRRLLWVAVGAVGGVVAYRKGLEAAEQARERGMVGNVQALQHTATTVSERARAVRVHVFKPAPPSSPSPLEPLAPLTPATTGTPSRVLPNGA